jgi:hypothetical protein
LFIVTCERWTDNCKRQKSFDYKLEAAIISVLIKKNISMRIIFVETATQLLIENKNWKKC